MDEGNSIKKMIKAKRAYLIEGAWSNMMVNLSMMCGEEGCGDYREERGVRSKISPSSPDSSGCFGTKEVCFKTFFFGLSINHDN